MFETHENGRRKTYFSLPNEYHWDYVGIALNNPWILVAYSINSDEGYSISQSIILSDVRQLIEMASREEVEIQFVDIVSPGHINKTGRWKMEPLKEIWLRVNAEYKDQYEHVFILEDGNSRIEMAAPPENKSLTEEKIFSL